MISPGETTCSEGDPPRAEMTLDLWNCCNPPPGPPHGPGRGCLEIVGYPYVCLEDSFFPGDFYYVSECGGLASAVMACPGGGPFVLSGCTACSVVFSG